MKVLNIIQQKLKVPKAQRNDYGGFNYRSCGDILEAVKPLLGDAILTMTDELVLVGDRYYVKAIATLSEGEKLISVCAFARESLEKKGMDSSQITGATSSYARKYALNGLFAIDDTKDADSQKHDDANSAQGAKKKADKEFDAFMNVKPVTYATTSTAKSTATGHIYKSCQRCKKAVSREEEKQSFERFGQTLHVSCDPL